MTGVQFPLGGRDEFRAVCGRAEEKARRTGEPVIASWSARGAEPDWLDLLDGACPPGSRSFFWRSRWSGLRLVGLGSALDLVGHGPDRFSQVKSAWSRHVAGAVAAGAGGGPVAVGGFSFKPTGRPHPGRWPDGLMWLPAVQVVGACRGEAMFTFNALVTPGCDVDAVASSAYRLTGTPRAAVHRPTRSAAARCTVEDHPSVQDWMDLVGSAVGGIGHGDFTKVVLARELRAWSATGFDVPAALSYLDEHFPRNTVFAAQHDEDWFFGATPECLVLAHGRRVETVSLAGSLPRGEDARRDAELERALLGDRKLRREQAVVTDSITATLRDMCVDVDVAGDPVVLKLPNVQHLSTRLTGTLPPGAATTVLDLVEHLHPTPAVGGYPTRDALEWLDDHEPFDRGWYAGPVGWMDARHDGEMAVAIRSARVAARFAELYAGCGIVEGSQPELELAETRLKLAPMLRALGIDSGRG